MQEASEVTSATSKTECKTTWLRLTVFWETTDLSTPVSTVQGRTPSTLSTESERHRLWELRRRGLSTLEATTALTGTAAVEAQGAQAISKTPRSATEWVDRPPTIAESALSQSPEADEPASDSLVDPKLPREVDPRTEASSRTTLSKAQAATLRLVLGRTQVRERRPT